MNDITQNTPRTDAAASESISAVYEKSKQLEIELQRVTKALHQEREWLARDRQQLQEIAKKLTDLVK
jgi:hypothetical protein